jgi:hypothetical protein
MVKEKGVSISKSQSSFQPEEDEDYIDVVS